MMECPEARPTLFLLQPCKWGREVLSAVLKQKGRKAREHNQSLIPSNNIPQIDFLSFSLCLLSGTASVVEGEEF